MQVPMPLLNQPPDDQVRVFESRDHVLDEEATARLAALVKDADLAAPPVALPDFHQEKNMEAPCSIAVATQTVIRVRAGRAVMAVVSSVDWCRRGASRHPLAGDLHPTWSSTYG